MKEGRTCGSFSVIIDSFYDPQREMNPTMSNVRACACVHAQGGEMLCSDQRAASVSGHVTKSSSAFVIKLTSR